MRGPRNCCPPGLLRASWQRSWGKGAGLEWAGHVLGTSAVVDAVGDSAVVDDAFVVVDVFVVVGTFVVAVAVETVLFDVVVEIVVDVSSVVGCVAVVFVDDVQL